MLTTKFLRGWQQKLLPASLVLCVLLAGCTPPGVRALLEGDRLIGQGKYPQAVLRLQKATQLLPANAQAWNLFGLALHHAGNTAAALQAYEQARHCDPNLTAVRYNLGCLLLEQNNPQQAAAELTTYTLLQRDSADGWLKLGTAELRTKQWDSAERSFQNALRLRPESAEAWNGMGVVQTQRRHPKEALNCFNTALQKQPDFRPALLNSVILHHCYLNNQSLALQLFQDYTALPAKAHPAPAVEETLHRLQAELSPPPRREPTNLVANAPSAQPVVRSNAPAHTAATANPPVVRSQTNAPAATSPAVNLVASRPKPAETILDSMPVESNLAEPKRPAPEPPRRESSAHNEPPARTGTGTTQMSNSATQEVSKPAPAVKSGAPVEIVQVPEEPAPRIAQDQTLTLPPAAPQNAATQPVVRANSNQLDEATALLLSKVREEDTAEPTEGQEKKRLRDRLNPANWFKGKKKSTSSSESMVILPEVGIRTDAGTNSPTTAVLAAAPAPPPKPAPIRHYAYKRPAKPAAGNRAKADPYFAQAVQAQRDGHVREALDGYHKATRLDPSFFEAQYNLGLAAYELKDWPQSLSAYEAALSINPTSINARYNFALALQQGGYYEEAAKELEKLLEENPDEARAHLSLASIYAEQLGQPTSARPHYRRVLELEPQHPQAPAIRYWLAANP
jgi:tetratricopeptide (TPR) repeat protein